MPLGMLRNNAEITSNLSLASAASSDDNSSSIVTSFPISEAQLEIWLHSQLCEQANCAFNETLTLELRGSLDIEVLKQSLQQVTDRHQMLRATFSGDGKTVHVSNRGNYEYSQIDMSELPSDQQWEQHTSAIQSLGNRPFDLQHGPLVRIRVTKLESQRHFLTVSAHHIVMDGWSAFVFVRDLGHIYDSLRFRSLPTLPAAEDYSVYSQAIANHLASQAGQADAQYWHQQFANSIPVLDLPTDHLRPDLRTYASDRFDYSLNSETVSLLRKSAATLGCSLFNFLFTGFQAFLARLTGQVDICVGVPTAGQAAMNFHNLIGHCVNTVPIRNTIDLSATVEQYARQSRQLMLDSLEHQRYTFGTLIRDLAPSRDPSRPPVFSVMMSIDPELEGKQLGFSELEVSLHVEPRMSENFEWFISGVIRRDGCLDLQCQYNRNLFSRPSIEHYLHCLVSFWIAMAEHPRRKLSELTMLSLPQRQKVTVQWNATDREYPNSTTVFQEFGAQVQRTPDRPAVTFDQQTLSYHQLNLMVNQLAQYLRRHGVQRGDRVGICMPRSLEMLASALAVWQVGAAYVPLDPNYPADRLLMMAEDAGLRHVIAMSSLSAQVVPEGTSIINLMEIRSDLAKMPHQPLDLTCSPTDIAYVIYTSGSTGKPKGVQVPHGSVVNFLYAMREQPGISEDDRLLAITTLSFDISVLELFLPLISGAKLVIADSASAVDGRRLKQLIQLHDITFLQATPSTWRILLGEGWRGNHRVKALCGGEAFPRDLAERLINECSQVWNMYGPTETTVWSTAYQITDPDGPILIGKPIANTQLYILDSQMQQVPIGAIGELYIGGAGVTLGYLNREELTEARFPDNPFFNPFKQYMNYRLYQTGDMVRYRHDGNVEYIQRNDKQIKLRGYRIELGEIEYRLSKVRGIVQAVVVVREDQPGDSRLVAYYVAESSVSLSPSALREILKRDLPDYMIPQYFMQIEQLPQTANGKIDRKLLPPPHTEREQPCIMLPQNDAQRRMARIWGNLLQMDQIAITDNFFDLGGHSLLVMQAIGQIEQAEGIRFSPQDFLVGTLEYLAAKLPRQNQAHPSADRPL